MRTLLLGLLSLLIGHVAQAQFDQLEARTRAALAKGKAYKAINLAERALTRKDAPGRFHILRAEGLNRIGRYDQALEELSDVPDMRQDPEYRTNLIGGLTGSGRIDSAVKLVRPRLPDDASAEYLYRAGRVLAIREQWAAALAHFDAGVRKEPASSRMLRERGACHAMLGDGTSAKADLDEAVRLAPRDAASYNSRGFYLHLLRGDHAAAIADMDRAIKQDPNYGYAFSNRGWCHFLAGDTAKALRDLRLAVRKSPSNAYAFRSLGIVELATGAREQGCSSLRTALALGYHAVYGPEVQGYIERSCPQVATPVPAPVVAPTTAPVSNAPDAPKGRTNAP